MNYNYLFDLTPINHQEQLICSDYLEDHNEENLAHCLRFNYKICNYTNREYNYGNGNFYNLKICNKFLTRFNENLTRGNVLGNGRSCGFGSDKGYGCDYTVNYYL